MIDLVIIGLGNIGEKYRFTRHNIGWLLIEKFSEKYELNFSKERGDYYSAEKSIFGKNILFVLPTTYMNNSGIAAKQIMAKYKVKPKQICILVDEYNFPIGKFHLKATGSSGGHNGVTSMIEELGTNEFMRFRLGIDKKFGQGELVDYVLSNFSESEFVEVNKMLDESMIAIEYLVKVGFDRAMSEINSRKIFNSL